MKKLILALTGLVFAAALVVVPANTAKAGTDYILTSQAESLYYQAQSELDTARRDRDYAQDRLNDARNGTASQDEINSKIEELNRRNDILSRKYDKVDRARYVLEFVRTRSDSEIFLASMQEKFRNQASLKPMQDEIDGAKAVAQAQLTQIQVIQQAIKSQTDLAKVNPQIFAQVQELNNAYQVEMAQYQQEQAIISQLQQKYNQFAATMPMPTATDNMKLAEIRSDFSYACQQFDVACAE